MMQPKKSLIILAYAALVSCQQGYEIETPSFSVNAPKKVYLTGEPVVFDIKGKADIISFYSGEFGNDYAYAFKERLTPATMMLSFNLKQSASGTSRELNPRVVPVSYSTDFSGEYTQEDLDAATWTDISDRFVYPAPDYKVPMTNGSVTSSNLGIDIEDCFSDGKPIYLRFDYNVSRFDSSVNTGRTTVQILNFSIQGHTDFADIQMYSIKEIGWGFVQNASWEGASDRSSLPGAQEMLVMGCEWNPSQDRSLVAVAGPISKAADVNSGVEPSVHIKGVSDPDPESYSYTFEKAGEYDVVFVALNTNSYGKVRTVHHIKVNVVDNMGSVMNPEEGEWK